VHRIRTTSPKSIGVLLMITIITIIISTVAACSNIMIN
jgi:hypothetical protein